MIYTIVTTAPRPNPTIEHCLASMEAAGFIDIDVTSDGGYDGRNVFCNKPPLGGFLNWCRALELGIASESDWILIVEDDTLWCPDSYYNITKDLARLDDELFGYLSLYACRRVSTHLEKVLRVKPRAIPHGIYESNLGWSTWGSQALLLSRGSAQALDEMPLFNEYRNCYVKNRNRDAIVSRCFAEMRRQTLFRIPSLLSHGLGDGNSSLGDKPIQDGLKSDYPGC